MKKYQSLSSEKTQALGEAFAKQLTRRSIGLAKKKEAVVVALQGTLGAGKTTFTQGFFTGLGLKRRAQSPTFIIMRRHRIPAGNKGGRKNRNFKDIFHIDAYRLKNTKHMQALDFQKILSNPQNVILVEWPERIKKLLPKNTAWISFKHGKKENERTIETNFAFSPKISIKK
jgi:tRNA threonylcarbamoyladenosine biosynthesis protein TsaE